MTPLRGLRSRLWADYLMPSRLPEYQSLLELALAQGYQPMRHGDFELCETKAIATYLDRNFDGPKLIPDDARAAAQTEKWVSIINTMVDPLWVRRYNFAYIFPKTADDSFFAIASA